MRSALSIRSGATLLALSAALFGAACLGPPEPPGDPNAYLNWGPDATYIGKAACGECHQENYGTFLESQMGRSFRPARDSLSNADWTMDDPILDPNRNLWYQPVRRGQDLYVREFRIVDGDTVHHRLEKIDYIVGSGQHTNSHMRLVNGFLYQIPMTWYAQARKWGLPPGFDGGDSPRFNRPIPDLCMSCHDGPAEFVEGSENRFDYIPHGIECENCHGPGSVHADAIRAGQVVDTEKQIDRTIVHPGKLPAELRQDICEKCHMQGAAVMRPGRSMYDFRPGQRLTDYVDVFWPRFPDSTRDFIMASHPDRMRMSACFQASWDPERGLPEMTCVTCHNPHLEVKAKTPFEYNAPCRACHALPQVADCSEVPEVRTAVEDDCSSCHMPQSTTIDIPNIHITDHYIRVVEPMDPPTVPYPQRTDFLRMASMLRDSVGHPTLAEGLMTYYEEWAHRPFYLDSAAAALARAPADDPLLERAQIRLWFLKEQWDPIRTWARATRPDSVVEAWTAYRVAEAYVNSQDYRNAVPWFERTVALAPDHLRFRDRLGSAYLAAGRTDEAVAAFDAVLARDPTVGRTRNNRGFARLVAGDLEGGEEDLQQALHLEPDFAEAMGNLASLYVNTGRATEALPYARRLVQLNPGDARYAQFLRDVQAAVR